MHQFAIYLVLSLLLFAFPIKTWCVPKPLAIELTGLPNKEKGIVLANLSIKSAENENNLNSERIYGFFQLAPEEITTTLKALGYYHTKVSSELLSTPHGFIAKYHVELGPPLLIRKVSIKILGKEQKNSDLRFLAEHPSIKTGGLLNHRTYEIYKQNLLSKALQLGFLDAVFNENEIRLDPSSNRADIYLELETGEQFKFGDVYFESPPYPTDYLKRYIPFSKGDPYTTEGILSLQKTLIDSDLFNKVRIDPELNETQNFQVPLKVRLMPKPHNKYTASLGFGTDTGIRSLLGWERRRSAYPGHRININGRVSKRYKQLNTQYSIPGRYPATDKLAFGVQVTEERPPDHTYNLSNEASITHLQKRGRLEQFVSLNYLSVIYRRLPTDPKDHTHFLLPSAGYVWNNIKKHTLLQHGISLSFKIKGGLKSAFSNTNILKAEGGAKWIIPFGSVTRLIFRSNIGAIVASDFNRIPRNLRFFTGGDLTVRGYGFESLGPKELDRSGNEIVVGGRYLFVGSMEFERKVYKKAGVAIFMDSGNAMDRWKTRLSTGAGVGLRYETPLGPLRLDVARPVMKGKHRFRVHLNFGMDL